MRISSLEEYALRCSLCLARAYEESKQLSASQISKQEGLSLEYTAKILHLMKKAGLVSAQRGASGGYFLKGSPEKISIRSVLSSVQEKRSSRTSREFCEDHAGDQERCVHLKDCQIRPVWMFLFEGFDALMDDLFLADLLIKGTEFKSRIRRVTERRMNLFFDSMM